MTVTRTTVRKHDEQPSAATLHDLSVYGRLASPERQDDGERLWLRFDGEMPIAATVIWSDADYLGRRFDHPIDREMMRSLALLAG